MKICVVLSVLSLALFSILIGKTVFLAYAQEPSPSAEVSPSPSDSPEEGHIIIRKNAIPDGSQVFTFHDNFGNSNPDTFTLTDTPGGGFASVSYEVSPGSYSISEDAVSGWKQKSAICDSGETIDSLDVGPGETVTCTFTNEKLAKIILIKNTVGGNDTFDFVMTGATLPASAQLKTSSNTASQTFSDIDPDNTYTISETVPSGWDLTSSKCSGTNSPNSITPNTGETITCTFTNTKKPKLTVIKHVQNNHGGTLTAANFTMHVAGTNVSNPSFSGSESGTQVTLDQGTYNVTENEVAGYTTTSTSTDCSGSINAGEEKTCTITNDDIAPRLTIIKHVINDNGGTKQISDFPLYVDHTHVISGETNEFTVGEHYVWEKTSAGYRPSIGGDCTSMEIDLNIGDNKTCIITNNDIPGGIRGVKFEDLNGNGVKDDGEPTLSNWTFNLSSASGAASTTTNTRGLYLFGPLNTGTYTITETQKPGWTQTTPNPNPITINLNTKVDNVNFGNFRNITISGLKWNDIDGNGHRGEGEPGLLGWTIFIDANGNKTLDGGEISAVTDRNGNYTFPNIGPGTYSICEAAQNGWTQTFPEGSACQTVDVHTSGQNKTGVNFGNILPSSIQ